MIKIDTTDNNTGNKYGRDVYTVAQVKDRLGIGRNKAYSLCVSGEFPFKRIGRDILIPVKTFEAWLYTSDTDNT